jgi:nucleotide-binding universal stress UspA family protein
MLPIRKILHPTDFSDRSQAAFEMASALARDYAAELVVVHVDRPMPIFAPDGIAVAGPTEEPYEARVKLAEIRPTDPRVTVTHHLLEGDPAEQILKAARAVAADLIVLGTHGTTGLARLLMGSVAESVVRKAACPVLTVKAPFPEAKPVEVETITETVPAPA